MDGRLSWPVSNSWENYQYQRNLLNGMDAGLVILWLEGEQLWVNLCYMQVYILTITLNFLLMWQVFWDKLLLQRYLVVIQVFLLVKCLFQAARDYDVVLLLASSDCASDSSCSEGQLTLSALINRSLIYLQHGDYSNALSDLLSAAKLSPRDKTIYQTLGVCYHKLALYILNPSFIVVFVVAAAACWWWWWCTAHCYACY